MKAAFSSLIFWFYFITKKGHDRDVKIERLENLIISNFFLFSGIMGLTHSSGLLVTDGDKAFFVILAVCIICQTIFQCTEKVKAFKRNNEIESIRGTLKEGFGLLFTFSGIALEGLLDEFKDIINEFYNGFDNNNHQNQYQGQYYKNNFNSKAKSDETSEITRIFEKYNLSFDADENTIKKQFRVLAKKYHPDMPDGDAKLFMELKEDIEFLMHYIKMKKGA